MSAFVRVIIDRSIRRELDYSVPEAMTGKVVVGSRVRVPFRDKSLLATVVATLERKPGRRNQADHGIARRKARPEREPDRAGPLDGELLLLPD